MGFDMELSHSAPASLRDYQVWMLRGVFDGQAPREPGLFLYRELVRAQLQDTLDSVYRVTSQVFEEVMGQSWVDAGDAFITSHLPRDFRLNWCVKEVPAWIGGPLWLRELADYEWIHFQVSTSPDVRPEGQTGLYLNPSLSMRRYQHPVPRAYRLFTSSADFISEIENREESAVLVFRDPDSHEPRSVQLHSAVFDLLEAGREELGTEIVSALERHAEYRPILEMLVRQKILLPSDAFQSRSNASPK